MNLDRNSLLAAIFSAFASTTPLANSNTSEIVLRYVGAGKASVEYQHPTLRTQIDFYDADSDTHSFVRSKLWQPSEGCTVELDRSRIRLPKCDHIRFILSWDGIQRDRRYPPLIPLQHGGVLVFTKYLQTFDGNGPTSWKVIAPKGGVAAFRGQKSSEEISIPGSVFAEDPRGWIYLGPDKFVQSEEAQLMVDEGVSDSVGNIVAVMLPQLIRLFATELAARPLSKPSVFIGWANREVGGRSFQADTVPGSVIRFGLSGSDWATPSSAQLETIRDIASHELAHLWNAGVYSSEARLSPWLHEGNAELLSQAAQYQLGYKDLETLRKNAERAIASCLQTAGDQSWPMNPERLRGRIPYDCGFAIQLGAVGVANRCAPEISTMGFWKQHWAKFPRYDESTLVAFLSAVSTPNKSALLKRLLDDKSLPLQIALADLYRESGLLALSNAVETGKTDFNIDAVRIREIFEGKRLNTPRYAEKSCSVTSE